MISPINLFSWNIKNYYMGYIGMAFYSNPATVMIRPFALIIFLITAKILSDHPIKNKLSAVLSLGILNVIGILTKPTFAISFLPTVGLISLYKLIKKQSFKLSIIIFGIGIPSVVTLAWQYLLTYTGNWSNSRIIWAPFAVSQLPISAQLLRYIASIAFPLLVYFLYFQYTKNDFYLNFSWLILLISTFLMFSLAESGDRFSHGNFFAAGNISLFILYIISTKVFLQENKDILYTLKPIKLVKFAGASSIYLMHFVSGVAFYLWHVFSLTIDLPWWTKILPKPILPFIPKPPPTPKHTTSPSPKIVTKPSFVPCLLRIY